MIRIERQAKILQIIREREYIENSELTKIFDVTQATIRRDLKSLNSGATITGTIIIEIIMNGTAPTENKSHNFFGNFFSRKYINPNAIAVAIKPTGISLKRSHSQAPNDWLEKP